MKNKYTPTNQLYLCIFMNPFGNRINQLVYLYNQLVKLSYILNSKINRTSYIASKKIKMPTAFKFHKDIGGTAGVIEAASAASININTAEGQEMSLQDIVKSLKDIRERFEESEVKRKELEKQLKEKEKQEEENVDDVWLTKPNVNRLTTKNTNKNQRSSKLPSGKLYKEINNKTQVTNEMLVANKDNDDDDDDAISIENVDDDEDYQVRIDDQYIDAGQYIDLPWLASGVFNWSSLVEQHQRRRGEPKMRVSFNYLPCQKTITDEDAIQRCIFLGKRVSDENTSRCLQEMQNFRDNIRKTIQAMIFKYWIYNANRLGLRMGHEANRKLRNITDLLLIFRTPQSFAEVKKVCYLCIFYLMYTSYY